jgi:hypothetical protein
VDDVSVGNADEYGSDEGLDDVEDAVMDFDKKGYFSVDVKEDWFGCQGPLIFIFNPSLVSEIFLPL